LLQLAANLLQSNSDCTLAFSLISNDALMRASVESMASQTPIYGAELLVLIMQKLRKDKDFFKETDILVLKY